MRLVILALTSAFFGFASTDTVFAQRDVVFSTCNFQVTESQRQSNLSFTQVYKLVVNGEGRPNKISRIPGKESYVSDETAKACIEDWKFKGFSEGQSSVASFRWDHGLGWTSVTVAGNGLSRKIVDGDVDCKTY